MVRPHLFDHNIPGSCTKRLLGILLKGTFIIHGMKVEQCPLNGIFKNRDDHPMGSIKTGIQVNSCKQRFKGIGKDGILVLPAGKELSLSQLDKPSQVYTARHLCQSGFADKI